MRGKKLSITTYVVFGLVLLLVLWFGIGTFMTQEPIPDEKVSKLFAVNYINSQAQDYPDFITLNGQTAPNQTIILAPEVEGLVSDIVTPAGKYVDLGTELVTIAPDGKDLILKSTKAALDEAQLKLTAAKRLNKEKYLSSAGLKAAQAVESQAKANYKQARLALKKVSVKAPFSGVVNRYQVEVGSYLNPRAPNAGEIGSFVQLNPLKIIAHVSQDNYSHIKVGQPASATLVTGEKVRGSVTLVSPVADPTTRTYLIEILMENPEHKIPAGMSATLRLEKKNVRAHQIPPSTLVLSEDGSIGVRVVLNDDIVRYYPVTIISSDPTNFVVTGLPEESKIITVGQEFVVTGEKVSPHLDNNVQVKSWNG